MDHLWAPWRLSYVTQPDASKPKAAGCFICRSAAEVNDRENLVIHRSELGIVIANRFPYNNGHLLVAPLAHKSALSEMTTAETLDTQNLLKNMIELIEKTMNAEGFNVGLNLGKVAGAGLPGHLHWHIVPRWNGDTNFMPVLTDTKVIVQSLDSLWETLTKQMGK
ncbi:HIT domain-containing protein [Telmatocola sphagniphila]|uniref:HIT domain-containing protein n=1 Tax=Telmatocola sphagniphila TaxID=1123043 RepID=A0A8E6B9Z8_9BACT|nr:HIT domain-containing protein [Telmatocola sphagniphila]QVL33288.1 HIT domain-containing protein [Telmatocola sphagniphila]